MINRNEIIIKKRKKKDKHESHGGSWKIAYADFVTAMMAFFMLMWLINITGEAQKKGIADYFSPNFINMESKNGSVGMMSGENVTNSNNSSGQSTEMPVNESVDNAMSNSEQIVVKDKEIYQTDKKNKKIDSTNQTEETELNQQTQVDEKKTKSIPSPPNDVKTEVKSEVTRDVKSETPKKISDSPDINPQKGKTAESTIPLNSDKKTSGGPITQAEMKDALEDQEKQVSVPTPNEKKMEKPQTKQDAKDTSINEHAKDTAPPKNTVDSKEKSVTIPVKDLTAAQKMEFQASQSTTPENAEQKQKRQNKINKIQYIIN